MKKDIFDLISENSPKVISLIDKLKDLNIKDEFEYGLLHTAIANLNIEVALHLIKKGIDVNLQDKDRSTSLHYAVVYDQPDIVKSLLDAGCDMSLKDKFGNTALWKAIYNADQNYDILKLLLEHGAIKYVYDKNKAGRNPMDFAEDMDDKIVNLFKKYLKK